MFSGHNLGQTGLADGPLMCATHAETPDVALDYSNQSSNHPFIEGMRCYEIAACWL